MVKAFRNNKKSQLIELLQNWIERVLHLISQSQNRRIFFSTRFTRNLSSSSCLLEKSLSDSERYNVDNQSETFITLLFIYYYLLYDRVHDPCTFWSVQIFPIKAFMLCHIRILKQFRRSWTSRVCEFRCDKCKREMIERRVTAKVRRVNVERGW